METVSFASLGAPEGKCGSFAAGSQDHTEDFMDAVKEACVGFGLCTLPRLPPSVPTAADNAEASKSPGKMHVPWVAVEVVCSKPSSLWVNLTAPVPIHLELPLHIAAGNSELEQVVILDQSSSLQVEHEGISTNIANGTWFKHLALERKAESTEDFHISLCVGCSNSDLAVARQ